MLPKNRDQILERIRKFREETLAATIAVGGRVAAQAVHRGREMLRDVVLPTLEDVVLPRVRERFPTLAQLLEDWKRRKIDGYLLDIIEESEEPAPEPKQPSVQEDLSAGDEPSASKEHDSGDQTERASQPEPEEDAAPEDSEPLSETAPESGSETESDQSEGQTAKPDGSRIRVSHDVLESAFSRNQLFKVLYLMNEVEKTSDGEGWMMAKDVSAKGEELGFHIRPGNVRKVLRQKAIPQSFVVWRVKPDGRSRAREYALTDDGRTHLTKLISELR